MDIVAETDSIAQHEWISAIWSKLVERESDPPQPFWLESDESQEYCRACAEQIAGYTAFDDPPDGATDEIHGGYEGECDGSVVCGKCGALLAYTLTKYGAETERDYYFDEGWDWDDPDECFQVARMLGGFIGGGAFDVADIPDLDKLIATLQAGRNWPVDVPPIPEAAPDA